jgi:ABC-2 type transport system permease protein
MRTIWFLLRKEFKQLFRDRFIGKAIFAIPIVQMLVLVPAITYEIRDVRMCMVDHDQSAESRQLVSRLEGSSFFRVDYATFSEQEANDLMHKDKVDLILQIPAGFGRETGRGNPVKLMVTANAINASGAQLSWGYFSGVMRDYQMDLVSGQAVGAASVTMPRIELTHRHWYNESLNYIYYMLPGVLGILVAAIGFMLAGLNMVKEKESGTIEQINVTPVRKYQFVAAKMIPYIVIGLIDLGIGISLGMLAFGMPFEGSPGLLFLSSFIFLIGALGLALLISTITSSQQQYMFAGFFFLIIFMLMSGIFTPLESMPEWAQKINLLNPVSYIMRINRMVMLKGSTFADISRDICSLLALSVLFTFFAIRKYRKTV